MGLLAETPCSDGINNSMVRNLVVVPTSASPHADGSGPCLRYFMPRMPCSPPCRHSCINCQCAIADVAALPSCCLSHRHSAHHARFGIAYIPKFVFATPLQLHQLPLRDSRGALPVLCVRAPQCAQGRRAAEVGGVAAALPAVRCGVQLLVGVWVVMMRRRHCGVGGTVLPWAVPPKGLPPHTFHARALHTSTPNTPSWYAHTLTLTPPGMRWPPACGRP